MYMLLLQTFLLMLAAFLLGATISCVVKRTIHRVSKDDEPVEVLAEPLQPAVMSRATPVVTAPVIVSAAETERFSRALVGETAGAAPIAQPVVASGPMIEVQPSAAARANGDLSSESGDSIDDHRWSYSEVAVASHDGSTLEPEVVHAAVLAPPRMPEPTPPPQPVPRVEIVKFERPADAPPDSDLSYVEIALATTGGYVAREEEVPEYVYFPPYVYPPPGEETDELSSGQSYAAIAVASHDGSTLPPEALKSIVLPAPRMPEPTPAPLPVDPVVVPKFPRPADAPSDPIMPYAAAAVLAYGEYAGKQGEPVARDVALGAYDPSQPFDALPEGMSYTLIALAGQKLGDAVAPGPNRMQAASAVAAVANLAAQRTVHAAADDDLTRISGIDDVIASRLNFAGVTKFSQIAAWNSDDVSRMSQTLGFFGRVQDEYWIQQAQLLSGSVEPAAANVESTVFTDPDEGADVPPQAEPPRATPYSAADTATAAAAAAAAAMGVMSAARRRRPDPETDASAVDDAGTSGEGDAVKTDLTGLRSIRSSALVGDADVVRGDIDDLKRIRGIGVLIEKKLNSLGITSYEQVANWSGAEIDRISNVLDFKGRIERENWIEQARILASGGATEFSRRVDKGEI